MREVYLDNASATPLLPEVREGKPLRRRHGSIDAFNAREQEQKQHLSLD